MHTQTQKPTSLTEFYFKTSYKANFSNRLSYEVKAYSLPRNPAYLAFRKCRRICCACRL